MFFWSMSNQINKILISGGIGDFLQCLDIAVCLSSDFKVIVMTHFKGAEKFFAPFCDTKNYEFIYFDDLSSYSKAISSLDKSNLTNCPRSKFMETAFPYEVESPFDNDNEIIGIHPFGSGFAKNAYNQLNFPEKRISKECVEKIIKPDKNYLIFGSEKEILEFDNLKDQPNVCLVAHPEIWVSLSHIQLCKKVIAVDSSIKTMALVKKISTYLIVGDFPDETRDKFFINPYLDSEYLQVFLTKNPQKNDKEIIEFVKKEVYKNN